MTTTLEQACNDLTAWLPRVAVLLAQPDTDGTHSHGKPHSTPPWNAACAHPLFDALEGIRRLHAAIRYEVTGRAAPPRSHAVTGATLAAIPRLAEAASRETYDDTVYELTRYTTIFLQLPAVDLEERPQKVRDFECPYCRVRNVWFYPRARRVACLRPGVCYDADGRHPVGLMAIGAVSGEPYIAWADGLIQQPEGTP